MMYCQGTIMSRRKVLVFIHNVVPTVIQLFSIIVGQEKMSAPLISSCYLNIKNTSINKIRFSTEYVSFSYLKCTLSSGFIIHYIYIYLFTQKIRYLSDAYSTRKRNVNVRRRTFPSCSYLYQQRYKCIKISHYTFILPHREFPVYFKSNQVKN